MSTDKTRIVILMGLLVLSTSVASWSQNKDDSSSKSADGGKPQTIIGCLTGYDDRYTLGASSDTLYLLEGDNETFKRYNAKMVRVTGTVTEPPPGTSKHDVLSQQPPTLKVTSLKKVADGCN
jgi:hypothetical protein